jgi:transcriptional regulator with PAS, ATPase and Fis domain
MQARLLRVLQERVYEPLGSVESVEADVRVIAATNKDLSKLVAAGTFRQDLYYRINVIRLRLPLLKERREDIPLLVERFISRFNRLQSKAVAGVSDETLALLMEHDYPGNVRELENIIEHAFVLCRGGLIEPHQLPPTLRGDVATAPARGSRPRTLKALEALHIEDAIRRHAGNRTAAAKELGINPSTLFRKIKSLGLDLPEPGRRQPSGR